MKPPATRCKCQHCQKFFVPNYRNHGRQKYCSSPACRSASKQVSQRRWLSQPGNQDYFRGPENVKRVQQWRADHPGYSKRPPRPPRPPLQDACSWQTTDLQEFVSKPAPPVSPPALQDLWAVKTPLLVGLSAQFTDATLPEDKLSGSSGLTRESYLKFALPAMHGSVADAQLRLWPSLTTMPGVHAIA